MSTRVVERVDDWSEQSFSGGYRGLHDLADQNFSGVVRAGGAELFMTKGVVVGIQRGSIEDFEDASGTQYEAPTPALPLLAVMQERSDEVRAEYYTEDTAISQVDSTLSDGGFTGFVELSENVLSGDYYLVYHRGRAMNVAYVGNSSRLITGDEAFEQADDEVGIYEVRPVEIDAIEIPEPAEPEPDEDDAVGAAGSVEETPAEDVEAESADDDENASSESEAQTTESESEEDSGGDAGSAEAATEGEESSVDAETVVEPETESEPEADASTPEADEESATDETAADEETRTEHVTDSSTSDDEEQSASGGGQSVSTEPSSEGEPATTDPTTTPPEDTETRGEAATESENGVGTTTAGSSDRAGTPSSGSQQTATPSAETELTRTETSGSESPPTPSGTTGSAVETTETERSVPDAPADLEMRAIPSLDPERTETVDHTSDNKHRGDAPGRSQSETATQSTAGSAASQRQPEGGAQQREQPQQTHQESQAQSETTAEPESEQSAEASVEAETEPTESESTAEAETDEAPTERVTELKQEITERESEIDRLEDRLETVESERDDARARLAQTQEQRDELEAEVERLRSELNRLEEELGAATDADRRMTAKEALDGTDLFVRYHSKGEATLEKAHDSGVRREEFDDNLRLEKHTQFDAGTVAVGGQEFDAFLEDRVEYKFVDWVIRDLLFEIQSTSNTDSLQDLYDALPKINRVDFNGVVTFTDEEDTEKRESFDVVFRARMGDPLLVANINDSRQGATESMMERLITAAENVGKSNDQFASAFLVTESFFEPEALETVAAATRGGILSRDKRKSFVNLSRKQGYHLCLVEARNENFHLEVPEL